jgi:membrane-associated protease RseP (regulator of RpoE activity)
MVRNTLVAVVTVVGLTTWGAAESFAQDNPQLNLRPQALVVTQVFPGSTAARQGIEVGDVIASVDGYPVRSLADMRYRLGQAGPAAELGLIDVRTGWQNAVTVYPQYGRIGVDVQPTSAWNDRPVRPIRPIYPPWTPGVRPTPTPGYPGNGDVHIQPVPGPRPMPGR